MRKSNRTHQTQNSGQQTPCYHCMIRVPDFFMRNISACPVAYDKSQSFSCQGNRPSLIILSVDGTEAHFLRRRRLSFRQRRPRPPGVTPPPPTHLSRSSNAFCPRCFTRLQCRTENLACNMRRNASFPTPEDRKGKPTLIITTDATRREGMELMEGVVGMRRRGVPSA